MKIISSAFKNSKLAATIDILAITTPMSGIELLAGDYDLTQLSSASLGDRTLEGYAERACTRIPFRAAYYWPMKICSYGCVVKCASPCPTSNLEGSQVGDRIDRPCSNFRATALMQQQLVPVKN